MNALSSFVPSNPAMRAVSDAQDALLDAGHGVPGPIFVRAYNGSEYGDKPEALMPPAAAAFISELTGVCEHHITILAYGLRSIGLRIAPAIDAKSGVGQWLTPRQMEIMDQVALGKSNKEVARAVGLAETTVKLHMKNIMQRMGVRNRTAAALVWKGGVA